MVQEVGGLNISIVLLGVGLLVALAVLAGRVDAVARDDAWEGIVAQRRAIREERRPLAECGDALVQDAGVCPCRGGRRVGRLFGRATTCRTR